MLVIFDHDENVYARVETREEVVEAVFFVAKKIIGTTPCVIQYNEATNAIIKECDEKQMPSIREDSDGDWLFVYYPDNSYEELMLLVSTEEEYNA